MFEMLRGEQRHFDEGRSMPKKQKKASFGYPGAYAVTRNQAGGDWAAGLLLYRLIYRWRTVVKKLYRHGREWIAMSRIDWAREAGLSEAEMKNRALPKLRKLSFVKIRAMKVGKDKRLWMSLDWDLLEQGTTPWDMYEPVLNGAKGPGYEKEPGNYPYKDDAWE
jgi:hypothetical protein